jgi:transposase
MEAKPARKTTEASRLVRKLLSRGMRTEEIAVRLEVHNNSVLRWRDGIATPHRSRLERLRRMISEDVS